MLWKTLQKKIESILVFLEEQMLEKSTLVNALTGQEISIVSQEKGTTTDVVKKKYGIVWLWCSCSCRYCGFR